LDQLGLNWQGLLVQLINFMLLLLILRSVAYKPILRVLDERSERIRESVERAEQVKVRAAQAEEEFAARLQEARRQGQEIVTRANQVAERIHQESEERAKRDAEEFLVKARAEIERDRQKAAADLRSEVADLALLAASRVVGSTLDPKQHYRLVEEALAEAEKSKLN